MNSKQERTTGAAEIGIWECQLPFDIVAWSDAVYDLFELPRGFRVTREETLGFYSKKSLEMLEVVRSRAIREGTGFTLDAEITTALGKPRWIRITATVECENNIPVRLFGTKQDITEEKTRCAAVPEKRAAPQFERSDPQFERHHLGSASL